MAKATITFEDQPEGVAVRLIYDPQPVEFEDLTEAQRAALAARAYVDQLGEYVGEVEPLSLRTEKGDE